MRYRGSLLLTLEGLDLRVNGGERMSIVGRTGAGKSTIVVSASAGQAPGSEYCYYSTEISYIPLYGLIGRFYIIPK
jgi:ATP-binding cassette subfamily C (CFTR/MRP) protein 1